MIRVAFPMRVDAFAKPGGDLLQVQHYIASGQSHCLKNDSGFSGEVTTDLHADLSRYNVIHLTNLDRPIELGHFYRVSKRLQKPVVLSSIHHSYVEIANYEKHGRLGLLGKLSSSLSFQQMEALRSLLRSRRAPRLAKSTFSGLTRGIAAGQREVLEGVSHVLVLTSKEQTDISTDFPDVRVRQFTVLRNGFEGSYSTTNLGARDIPVCVVGRIEARKNQLAILEALEQLHVSGIFVGNENPYHKAYCRRFKDRIATSRSTFIGGVPQAEVRALMHRSAIHVSASWFEVSSLVDLEAYVAGCKVISSSCGGTYEILGDRALYVDPGSIESIRGCIADALSTSQRPVGQGVVTLPTWDQVAQNLASLYRSLIGL